MKKGTEDLTERPIERLFRLRQCAELTNTTEATWRKHVLLRKIGFIKVGGAVRIPESELLRFLDKGRVPAQEAR